VSAGVPARRLLVRLPNWVGDVVMATPALRALRAGFPAPGWEIVLHGKASLLSLLEGAPWFDRALPLETPAGGAFARLLGPLRAGRRLRAEGFDVAVLFPNSWSSAVAAWLARIPRRIGYERDRRSLILTDAVYLTSGGRLRPVAMVRYYLELCRRLGCPMDPAGARLELPASEEALGRADAYLRARGVAAGEPVLALSPGSAYGTAKMWEPEHFAAVAAHFAAKGLHVGIYGGPADRDVVSRIGALARARIPGDAPAPFEATDVPLRDLCAHMKRARALVSNDSGGRHFGVAAGIPVVVVMGSTHPAYTEVDYDRYCVLLERVECWPCHLRECPIDRRCMTRLKPERAIAAVEAYLAGRRPFEGARPWMEGLAVLDPGAAAAKGFTAPARA